MVHCGGGDRAYDGGRVIAGRAANKEWQRSKRNERAELKVGKKKSQNQRAFDFRRGFGAGENAIQEYGVRRLAATGLWSRGKKEEMY